MKKLITSIITISLIFIPITSFAQYDEIKEHAYYIVSTSKKYDINLKYLSGIIYHESRGRENSIGDVGYAFGLGQIRCHDYQKGDEGWFSWLRYLQENGLNIDYCKDLLNSRKNLRAIGILFNYYRDRYDWNMDQLTRAFHYGEGWWRTERARIRTLKYLNIVKIHGKKIAPILKARYKNKQEVINIVNKVEKQWNILRVKAKNYLLSSAKKYLVNNFLY